MQRTTAKEQNSKQIVPHSAELTYKVISHEAPNAYSTQMNEREILPCQTRWVSHVVEIRCDYDWM